MQWLLTLLGVDPLGKLIEGLNKAYSERLNAQNDADRIAADIKIKHLETQIALHREQAGVIKEGMQHKVFWVPWLIATVPLSAWFGWGMLDSLTNGALPDAAALPPQLYEFAQVVWTNLFYTGVAGVAFEGVTKSIQGLRKK